ncbi:MAG: metabolite traffic protein EboE, partial [Planctomycetota bacterium]|nr:metabolite traffic protein EboE [Planctomycetota bacterium]
MRLTTADGRTLWLAYGMNVHPGGDAAATEQAIHDTVLPLRERLGISGPFGLAVRWSAAGVMALQRQPQSAQRLAAVLAAHDLHVFSGNAFVHGDFHGRPLKAEVYEPGWAELPRAAYTQGFAQLLARLPSAAERISLSTSPLGWKGWNQDAGQVAACARALVGVARGLARTAQDGGRHVTLSLEPEPGCTLETTEELRAFFGGPLAHALGGAPEARAHLGVCYDVCHQAVEWEDAAANLEALRQDGIPVGKVQASCALELPDPTDADARAALARFDEPVYLHQVGTRDAEGGLHVADDLGDVLDDPAWHARGPWRSHFHVPVFRREVAGGLRTTQPDLESALRYVASHDVTDHVEI